MASTGTAQGAKNSWQRWGSALGFHVPVLAFALRTAVAAFVALLLAYAIGLEHPHWAAMSAWASSQPLREHLLARGFYRFAGSMVGVLFAVALVLVAQDSLWVLALGLAVWGGFCAFWGNAQRGYMVYGWMLAGYSAAMVVLLHHGPAAGITHLAGDRMLTVVTGVVAALAISWCFAPRRKAAVLIGQSRATIAKVLQAALAQVQGKPRPQGMDTASLLSQLAQVEELLELYPEGSYRARQTAQTIHWQQSEAMELVYQMAGHPNAARHEQGAAAPWLAAVAAVVERLQTAPQSDEAALAQALQHAVQQVQVHSDAHPLLVYMLPLLHALQSGLAVEQRDLGAAPKSSLQQPLPVLPKHRDWLGARQAGLRTGGTMLLVGLLWAWTGSSTIGFGLLGLSVMLLVFSSFESPSRTMAFVLRGQIIGAALALMCQAVVWPLAQSSTQMVWMVLPFALVGGLLFAHQRTAAGALDTNMAMFILLAPRFPDPLSMGEHTHMALAIVAGPALAWVVYRFVYPTQAVVRLRNVLRMMWLQVPAAAAQAVQGHSSPSSWVEQLHHRMLRLTRWADKTQWAYRAQLPAMGLALRSTQSVVEQLQQWRKMQPAGASTRAMKRVELALRRLSKWQLQAGEGTVPQGLQQAWQALGQQSDLPAELAVQVQHVAQHDLPTLARAQQMLQPSA